MEKRKKSFGRFVVLIMICVGSYIHGCRIITLEEIPSSHRPWQVYLSADYEAQHFSAPAEQKVSSRAESVFDLFGKDD